MARTREEIILPMDWDVLDACNGLSFDMGGTVMKLAFIDKEDWVEPNKRKKDSKGCLHLVNFSRPELEEAFDFINRRVRFNRKDKSETVEIFNTGFGGSEFPDMCKEKFNAKTTLSWDLYFQAIQVELEKYINMMKQYGDKSKSVGIHKTMGDFKFPQLETQNQDKRLTNDNDFYPCGLMICGSGFGFLKVNEDGSNEVAGVSARGGKTFLALASLLTNVKGFHDFMELCAKGKASNVSVTHQSIIERIRGKKTDEDDIYGGWSDTAIDQVPETALFAFGHAEGKTLADFKTEDIARCHLQTSCIDLAQFAHARAMLNGVKNVFFAGGFTNHPLVRQILTIEWLRNDYMLSVFSPKKHVPIQCHFLKHAQSLGAIGALLHHSVKKPTSTKQPDQQPKNTSAQSYKSTVGF